MKHRQKVLFGLALSALFMTIPGTLVTYAAGWSDEGGTWKYLRDDGTAMTDQWRRLGDDWYYLGSDGRMEQNSLFQLDDDYYYADEDGVIARERWMSFDAEDLDGTDYGAKAYWYYFGADGKAYRKKSNTFKKTVDGDTYIFDEDGIMLTGFINEDGDWIDSNEDPFVEARYYCAANGLMYRDQWLPYDYQGETSLRSDMAERDYMDYEQVWLFFDSTGKKVRSGDVDKLIQRTIGNETYGFDENGVMMSWWGQPGTNDKKSPAKFYSGYDGGKLLKNTWVWMYPSEKMDEDDYTNLEYSWWRTNDSGKVFVDSIREVGGLRYAFDDIGRMQTGFVLYDGTKNFVAQYDIDVWESDDFKDGLVYGIEKADLYLFGPDELNGGSMQKGKEITLELADGFYTFGFADGGKAYGSRNRLAKKNDVYYINGLRLEAEQNLKYGVVKVSDEEYRVVNTSGKISKGNRKLVKDGEDCWYVIVNDKFKAYAIGADKPRWHNGAEGEGYYQYNSDTREFGSLIAGKETEPVTDELPGDARLNFQ